MPTSEENRALGARGELLASAIMRGHGYTFVDIAAGGPRGASLVRSWTGTLVAPDGMMVRTRPLLVEIKTKSRINISRGGAVGASWMRTGTKFIGIDHANHIAYCLGSVKLAMPLVVLVIIIEDAVLVGATLGELGKPFPSLLPELYDMANFPAERFTLLQEFDANRLRRYFQQPLHTLTEPRMRKFVPWLALRAPQRSFDFVEFMTFDNADPRWAQDEVLTRYRAGQL